MRGKIAHKGRTQNMDTKTHTRAALLKRTKTLERAFLMAAVHGKPNFQEAAGTAHAALMAAVEALEAD